MICNNRVELSKMHDFTRYHPVQLLQMQLIMSYCSVQFCLIIVTGISWKPEGALQSLKPQHTARPIKFRSKLL